MFDFTLETRALLAEKYPERLAALCQKCGMTEAEFGRIEEASRKMYFPYNEEYGMYMQDDNFMYKDPVDLASVPAEKLPLLFTLHPLNLWRWQVCKQADIVLLTFLCSEFFDKEQIRKIFDYYEPKTIHDSSLSAAVHSIVACGYRLCGGGVRVSATGGAHGSGRRQRQHGGRASRGLHGRRMDAHRQRVCGPAGLRRHAALRPDAGRQVEGIFFQNSLSRVHAFRPRRAGRHALLAGRRRAPRDLSPRRGGDGKAGRDLSPACLKSENPNDEKSPRSAGFFFLPAGAKNRIFFEKQKSNAVQIPPFVV